MKEYKKEKKGYIQVATKSNIAPMWKKILLSIGYFYHMETAMHLNQVDQATMSQFDCGTTWQGYDKPWPSSKST